MRCYVSGVTESRGNLLMRESVLRLESFSGSSGCQIAENRRYIDSGPRQAWLSEANCGIHRNAWKHFHACASCVPKLSQIPCRVVIPLDRPRPLAHSRLTLEPVSAFSSSDVPRRHRAVLLHVPLPTAVRRLDVSAATTATARWLERLNLLLVLTLKGLHFLRVLTL